MYKLVASVRSHPDKVNPVRAIYHKRSLSAINATGEVDLNAISPRPFAPPLGPYSEFRKIPRIDKTGSYDVHHPRFFYLLPKKLFLTRINAPAFQKTVTDYIENTFDEPDLIHAGHIFLDGFGCRQYCEQYGVPLIVMGTGGTLNNFHSFSRRRRRMIRSTLEFSEAIMCVSDELVSIADEIVGDQSDVYRISTGVNPDRFEMDNRDRYRNELGVCENEALVLFCGSFIQEKGLNELMTVLQSNEFPNTHFIFVGHKGDLRERIEETVKNADIGTASTVLWQVPPDELNSLFVSADLLIHPSHSEGTPNVIYEAMGSNTAVLASDVGGISEQVTAGETGRLVPAKEVETLREVLCSMLDDPEKLRHFGRNGFDKLISEGWTWENHANEISQIHQRYI